ncbi:Ras-related protein Rap1, partial [Gryllus bimaculatus]
RGAERGRAAGAAAGGGRPRPALSVDRAAPAPAPASPFAAAAMSDYERIRLVILGGAGVGKSCIVKRFLFNTYTDKYRSTVDILDTAGDMQFPAMRRLSIATAHAFLLVYAITSAASFACVKRCFEEVREQRADFQEIPIVVAGNKLDLAASHREVPLEDVSEAKVMECSAKDDYNVRDIFRTFVTLSRILPPSAEDSAGGLKRRSSAYVSASKGGRRAASPAATASSRASAGADGGGEGAGGSGRGAAFGAGGVGAPSRAPARYSPLQPQAKAADAGTRTRRLPRASRKRPPPPWPPDPRPRRLRRPLRPRTSPASAPHKPRPRSQLQERGQTNQCLM